MTFQTAYIFQSSNVFETVISIFDPKRNIFVAFI